MGKKKVAPISTTADDKTPSKVTVPKNNSENRAIKARNNFVDDDNEDIAYLNFKLIWPVGITSFLSLAFFTFAIASMEFMDHLSFERYALNQLVFSYGRTLGFCNNTYPRERGMWPSVLRQIEFKVLTNVAFRVAVCVPMAIRLFVVCAIKNDTRENPLTRKHFVFYWLNELSGVVAIAEVFSLSMFAIVTVRFDYPRLYNAAFGLFVFAATIYMFQRTLLSFTIEEPSQLDQFATMVRLVSTIVFTWTIAQVFQQHQHFILNVGCHGYVRPSDALTEYAAIVAYAVFHLAQLVDIRDIRFICYPRTCGGECEPLRPSNFSAGGKYEHCRAYELVQRESPSIPPAAEVYHNGNC